MALITCPECGKEISSNAKQCVHCGCEITVCPECGSVYGKKTDTCPKCGFVFNTNKNKTESIEDDYKKLEKQINEENRIIKIVNIVYRILCVLGVVLDLLVIFLIYRWSEKEDSIEKLAEISHLLSTCKTIWIISSIMTFIPETFGSLTNLFLDLRRSRQITDRKIDYKDYLLSHDENGLEDGEAMRCYSNLATAAMIKEQPNKKITLAILPCLELVLVIIFIICFNVFGIDTMKDVAATALAGKQYSFNYNVASFYIGIATFVGWLVTNAMVDIIRAKQTINWLTQLKNN